MSIEILSGIHAGLKAYMVDAFNPVGGAKLCFLDLKKISNQMVLGLPMGPVAAEESEIGDLIVPEENYWLENWMLIKGAAGFKTTTPASLPVPPEAPMIKYTFPVLPPNRHLGDLFQDCQTVFVPNVGCR